MERGYYIVNFINESIKIKKGQFLTSKLKLMVKFGWTYKRVSAFLKALINDKMIEIETTKRYTLIKILGYESCQGDDLDVGKKIEQNFDEKKNEFDNNWIRDLSQSNLNEIKIIYKNK